jgi:hypothetical protein
MALGDRADAGDQQFPRHSGVVRSMRGPTHRRRLVIVACALTQAIAASAISASWAGSAWSAESEVREQRADAARFQGVIAPAALTTQV